MRSLYRAITHQTTRHGRAHARPNGPSRGVSRRSNQVITNAIVVSYALSALGSVLTFVIPHRYPSPIWRAGIGERSLSPKSISSPRIGVAAAVGLLAVAAADQPSRRPADLDSAFIVVSFLRARPEQHHGFRETCPRRVFAGSHLPTGGICDVHVSALDLALFTVHPTIASCHRALIIPATASAVDGELHASDVLVRLDCNGRVGSAHIRRRCRTLARALVATILVGMVVGDSYGSDDWMRLPHAALVSTLVTNVSCWAPFGHRGGASNVCPRG